MEITEVRVFLKEGADKKLKAYATITIDNQFVIRNVKIIQGTKGLFVAMPSRKLRASCPRCGHKNDVKSKFCNFCGAGVPFDEKKFQDKEARMSEHRDIAHPITQECREYIQRKVLSAYEGERANPSQKRQEDHAPVIRDQVRHTSESSLSDIEVDIDDDEGDIEL